MRSGAERAVRGRGSSPEGGPRRGHRGGRYSERDTGGDGAEGAGRHAARGVKEGAGRGVEREVGGTAGGVLTERPCQGTAREETSQRDPARGTAGRSPHRETLPGAQRGMR